MTEGSEPGRQAAEGSLFVRRIPRDRDMNRSQAASYVRGPREDSSHHQEENMPKTTKLRLLGGLLVSCALLACEPRHDSATNADQSVEDSGPGGPRFEPATSPEQKDSPALVALAGTVIVRVLDEPSGSTMQYLLRDEFGHRFVLDFATDPGLRTGEPVEVSGVWRNERVLAVDSFESKAVYLYRRDAPLVRTPKQHRVAILAMQQASVTEQQALEAMNGTVNSTSVFYAENSRNLDTFHAGIFKRYNISYTDNDCLYDNTSNITDAMINAFKNDGYNTANYDHIAVIVPDSCGTDWSGAWADGGSISDSGVISLAAISMYKDVDVGIRLFSHELGHNIGLDHARSMNCGSSVFYTAKGAGCSSSEYGNYNDVMGSGRDVYFSAPYQRFMGWTGAANIATAGQSGTFNLQPADGPLCGVRSVRIPIPGESGYYFHVEFRRARSDSRYAGLGSGTTRQNAVLITRSGDGLGENSSWETDRVELGTTRYQGALQGVRYDLGGGVAVKVLSMSGSYAQVAIEMPGSAGQRDDSGAQLFVESDGSNGSKSCGSNDACPSDANKTNPGICGCGVPDTDTDRDGTADCQDSCKSDASKTVPGLCGCGVAEGTCARVYQGESATAQSGSAVSTTYSGYTGSGYMNFGGIGTWMEWNNVNVATAGNYTLRFRYANRSSIARGCTVRRNGSSVGSVAFTSTGAWTSWATATLTVALNAGNNTIRVLSTSSNGGPNLDKMEVSNGGTSDQCPNDSTKTVPGLCGCGVPEGTCAQAPTVSMSKATYAVNENIVVNFAGAAGNSTDWVGLFASGAANTSYLAYQFTAGKVSGTMTFAGRGAGTYEARLFFNDGYTLKAKVAFTVR